MLALVINTFGLLINTINIPFDNGANRFGSKNSPQFLESYIDNTIKINKKIDINTNNYITLILSNAYKSIYKTFKNNTFPISIGGDHTISIASIAAANDYYSSLNKRVGILWCDAHADFNTVLTSTTKNIHGMPISVLCGHTLTNLKMGNTLYPFQFAYYGLRDIDSLEFDRIQKYNMCILENDFELSMWLNEFDYIYISFDIDCLDPSITKNVNTPVKNGKNIEQIIESFNIIKKSNKLCGLDIVEYNQIDNNKPTFITKILQSLF